jgi:hypothetical protein
MRGRERESRRAEDTRCRIALGSLIVTAGLARADRSFLLGALIEAAKIAPGSPEYERLSTVGAKVDDGLLA